MTNRKNVAFTVFKGSTVLLLGMSLFSVFNPKESSADVISILASVFKNNDISDVEEINADEYTNLQTMPILKASTKPLQASTTYELAKELKSNASIVEGKAITNENSSVSDGVVVADTFTSDKISLYTVRKNDTLEQVAKMFGVTTNTIVWANDLKRGVALVPDQVLIILPISSVKYTIVKGDTIQSVAKKFKSDVKEIAQFNSIDEDEKLVIGEDLMIPDADGSIFAAETKKASDNAKKQLVKNAPRFDSSSSVYVDTTGYFSRPVIGGVRTQGIHGHNGVDIASKYGTPILAAAGGQVIVSKTGGWGGGYGNYVVIKHSNGTQTLYGHMSEVLVQTGETVSRGQQIGKMGNTGRSTGVHLHFEVRGGKNPF